jgi:hypothetical protein
MSLGSKLPGSFSPLAGRCWKAVPLILTTGAVLVARRAPPAARSPGLSRTNHSAGGQRRCWCVSAATSALVAAVCGGRTSPKPPSRGRRWALGAGGHVPALHRRARCRGLGRVLACRERRDPCRGQAGVDRGPGAVQRVAVIGVDEHVWRHTRRGAKYVTVIIDLTRSVAGPARHG